MDFQKPHRRYNPLNNEWVLVSPHRAKRPWQGQLERVPELSLPEYDPDCYLCPRNKRAGGILNPDYEETFVFDNDFPALLRAKKGGATHEFERGENLLSYAEPVNGICRVVCFSPKHNLTLPELSVPEIQTVIETWSSQTIELGEIDFIQFVQVFENKGEVMGCSNPHPHSQIWATSFIPNEPSKEINAVTEYNKKNQSCLLCDYVDLELEANERIVDSNQHFVALVPFWAVWPFEILIISKRHLGSLPELAPEELASLAMIMKQITIKFDNLFEVSFPYSMGFHQSPTDGSPHSECHLHAHYYPPLLRSAAVRKFMVGFEMMAMPQRDLTAETAASRLRELPDVHYKSKNTFSDRVN